VVAALSVVVITPTAVDRQRDDVVDSQDTISSHTGNYLGARWYPQPTLKDNGPANISTSSPVVLNHSKRLVSGKDLVDDDPVIYLIKWCTGKVNVDLLHPS
jgi:hypothetical protein